MHQTHLLISFKFTIYTSSPFISQVSFPTPTRDLINPINSVHLHRILQKITLEDATKR